MTDQGASDYGNKWRHKHGVVKPELTGRGHAVRMRAHDNCELDRLVYLSLITHDEWSAGDSFARKLHAARMMGAKASSFTRVGGQGHISDQHAQALLDVADAHRWLDATCGQQVRMMTTHVCLSQKKIKAQEDVALLRLGLKALLDLNEGRARFSSALAAL